MRQPTKRLLFVAFALTILLTACAIPGIPNPQPQPTATATAMPQPPTIVETVPQMGSELGPKSTLLVFFNEAMDKASVEAALTSTTADGILLNWVDEVTLAITPKTAYPANGQVTFTLAPSAKTLGGLALPEAQTFSYRTASPLRVAQTLPAAQAVDVSPDSAVVVSFNQPVVALGAENAPAALTLEPAAKGQGEWINTSTYIFRPEPALSGGVDYNVRVNPQLIATNGTPLDTSNTSWTFRTSLPRLLEVTPAETKGPLLLDPELKLTFNQPMDRASAEAGVTLVGPNGKLTGSFIWNEKSTVVTFKPSTLLERSTDYALTVSGNVRSHGGATLGNDLTYSYQSMARFAMLSTPFTSGTPRPKNKGIIITFTAPFDKYKNSELAALITTNPKPDSTNYSVDGQNLLLYGSYRPGQSYIITFSRDLKDRWGQPLGENLAFSFREPDAEPSVSFGGFYSPMLFTLVSTPRLNVQAVNISQLDIVLGGFTLPDYFRYQSDYTFKKSYTPQQIDAWSELLDLAPNQSKPYTLDLLRDGKREPLPTGLYSVAVSSKQVTRAQQVASPVLISNVNITLKTSSNQAFLWAVDIRTQTAAANQPVTLYDKNGKSIASGSTDANGIWKGDFKANESAYDNIYAVLAQPGDELFGMASDGWNSEIAPWNFGLSEDRSGPSDDYYFYTERPVYRPGDVVHYRGILRTRADGRYTDAKAGNIFVSLNQPSGGQSAPQSVPISEYGTFNGTITLSANAIPGYYSINAKRSENPEDTTYGYGTSVSFQVADYRKPEINLSASLTPSSATNGQALTGAVNAAYFFGAPVNDLSFEWTLYKNRSSFNIPGYNTGLYHTDWEPGSFGNFGFGENIASGKGHTGADGTFSIALNQINVDDTAELTLEVTASESGGFPVSARATATLHPSSFYIGVRPATWFGTAGSPLQFDALTVDLEKKPVSGKSLTASFQKVTWERNDTDYSYSFTPTFTPVESQQLISSAEGKATVSFTPAEAGTYMLEVSNSEGAKTQTLLWVGGAQNAAWPNLPYQRMEITADKASYKPGDTASVFVPGQFTAPALALITTERGTIHSSQVVSIPPEGYTFTLPLTDEHAPNIYVAVTMLGPEADFRQGYVNLPVEPSAFTLNVDLKATPAKAKPGEKLTLDLTVTDAKGNPVQAEFSMGVVDLAALALAEPNSPEIVPAYYGKQPLGVHTGLTDTIYARRALPVVGGGGGGGGGDVILREKFPDTAYWKADIITDAQGKAQISFTLPDNLTTWKADTRGLTQDTKVGQANVMVVTSKDLLIRPQTPRFLVVGDQTELAAIVNNNTAADLEATVSLQATGFSLSDPATVQQNVTVPANGRTRVAWQGTVKTDSQIKSIFTVKAGSLQDSARPADGDIPVLHYSAPQTFSTAGVLTDAASRLEILAMPKSFKAVDGKLDVELSPSLASVIESEIQAESADPETLNWNNERLASHLLTRLSTYQTLKDASLSSAPLSESVLDAVRHLVANQNYTDNGWSWVTGSNQPTDPYLTAYILLALNQASKAELGITLNENLKRGFEYLLSAPPLDGKSDLSQPWALNRAAFYAYVLQQQSASSELDRSEALDNLYNNRDKLDPWAKALLAETLLSISATDERGKTLLSDLQSNPIRSATGVHWESVAGDGQNPNSPLFTSAAIVYVLAQRDPTNPILPDAVRYLATQRAAAQGWGSSYEKTWVVLALNQYMKGTGELKGSFNYSAALNGASLAKGDAAGIQKLESVTSSTPLSQMYSTGSNSLLISREAGTGKLYYRAALTLDRPVETAPAISQGLSISRQYFTCNGSDCQPVKSFALPSQGEEQPQTNRIKVQVSITLPNDAYYLMVQDNIPAGAEILDNSLKTSQLGMQSQEITQPYDNANPFADGWGWWYFNPTQIYRDHILWNANYLPAGTYVLTYTLVPSLPGQYHVIPAHVWQAYFPEVQGSSAGSIFEIKPAK